MLLRGGVHVPHFKNTADLAPVRMPAPAQVTLQMAMGIGAPAVPVVKAGDLVKVGQLVGEASSFISSPVYSSVSGKVKKIVDITDTTGAKQKAVIIESDGEQTMYEGIEPPTIEDTAGFLAAVRNSGVVGLGGAGFPTSVKLTIKKFSTVDYILINGAECEPYITSDTRTMLDDAPSIREGVLLLRKHLGNAKIIFGIEKNKPRCIKKMRETLNDIDNAEVRELPSTYPQGGEKVLIYNTTGRIVPEGGLPISVGTVVINCTTLAAVAKYIHTGLPLVSKLITVDGSAVKSPKNVIVPIGTHLGDVFEFCGGFKAEPRKVLYGGPMMGIALASMDSPILKTTNAIIAFAEKEARTPEPGACIRCGKCVDNCPMNLMPLELETAFLLNKPEMLLKGKVNLCMECGCCAYGCPANRPLVQTMKLAKSMLRNYQTKLKAESEAKEAAKNG